MQQAVLDQPRETSKKRGASTFLAAVGRPELYRYGFSTTRSFLNSGVIVLEGHPDPTLKDSTLQPFGYHFGIAKQEVGRQEIQVGHYDQDSQTWAGDPTVMGLTTYSQYYTYKKTWTCGEWDDFYFVDVDKKADDACA